MQKIIFFFLMSFLMSSNLISQTDKWLPLYGEASIPNSKPEKNLEKYDTFPGSRAFTLAISQPTFAVFPAQKPNGKAVIIFPGGGYSGTADAHEGVAVAKKLNEVGITAFVVRYRVPDDRYCEDKTIAPLQDAQHAIRYVRRNRKNWQIENNKIGIMGFSAGGHLAATATTLFSQSFDRETDDTTISARPDFAALIYPVISFSDTSIMHKGSRDNLLGKSPDIEKVKLFSPELHVTAETPPVFLVHAADDNVVNVENSLIFHRACVAHKVAAELHIYPHGGHGFGMDNKTTPDKWIERYINWVQSF